MSPAPLPAWLEDAVFYEIYPQTFFDTNADGIGDLNGVIQKLDYLHWLGVNTLWLNPCFVSPFQDAGYDVSDYYRVAPRYGGNDDLRQLFAAARQRGMRVLLDLVPGHTSVEHPWFQASARHQRNEYSDWFIWTDSAWKWQLHDLRVVSGFGERDGSYITNFFWFQPALNYGFAQPNPSQPWQQGVDAPGPQRVRQELRNIMAFWLEMGAAGFRVDMAFSLVKSDPGELETKRLWQENRAWMDHNYPEAVLLSEWGRPKDAIAGGSFHLDFLLPFGSPGYMALLRKPFGRAPGQDPYGYSFFDPAGHGNIQEFLDDYLPHYEATRGKGHIVIPTGNHDMHPRLSKGRSRADLELVYMFLMTMPGIPIIYYGDEIGMRPVTGQPSKEGGYNRTESRSPMQWDASPNAGFSTGPAGGLYLPIDPDPQRPTVAAQQADPNSLLHSVRHLIALRRSNPILQASPGIEILYAEAGKYPFVYTRGNGSERILIALNPSNRPVDVELPGLATAKRPRLLHGADGALFSEGRTWRLRLPGVSGGIYQI